MQRSARIEPLRNGSKRSLKCLLKLRDFSGDRKTAPQALLEPVRGVGDCERANAASRTFQGVGQRRPLPRQSFQPAKKVG